MGFCRIVDIDADISSAPLTAKLGMKRLGLDKSIPLTYSFFHILLPSLLSGFSHVLDQTLYSRTKKAAPSCPAPWRAPSSNIMAGDEILGLDAEGQPVDCAKENSSADRHVHWGRERRREVTIWDDEASFSPVGQARHGELSYDAGLEVNVGGESFGPECPRIGQLINSESHLARKDIAKSEANALRNAWELERALQAYDLGSSSIPERLWPVIRGPEIDYYFLPYPGHCLEDSRSIDRMGLMHMDVPGPPVSVWHSGDANLRTPGHEVFPRFYAQALARTAGIALAATVAESDAQEGGTLDHEPESSNCDEDEDGTINQILPDSQVGASVVDTCPATVHDEGDKDSDCSVDHESDERRQLPEPCPNNGYEASVSDGTNSPGQGVGDEPQAGMSQGTLDAEDPTLDINPMNDLDSADDGFQSDPYDFSTSNDRPRSKSRRSLRPLACAVYKAFCQALASVAGIDYLSKDKEP